MNEKIFLPVIITLIKDLKKEIEADGLIATADEILARLEVVNESNRITEHND